MAEINFENSQLDEQNVLGIENETTNDIPDNQDIEFATEVNENGMSLEEINDANKIKVTIADYKTPLIILFGPPSCGKTMTLVRLTRYLQGRGYTVEPVSSFRPAYDKHYIDICERFDSMINSDDAADSTKHINFMLVQVMYNGKPLCQILEGPGEYYFNPKEPNAVFPRYINAIINSKNRKIWAIMVEPDKTNVKMNTTAREYYVKKISKLKKKISPRDKIVFVYNKIDETHFVEGLGQVKYRLAMQNTEFLYPNIFEPFKNVNPITKFWQPYRFGFVAFHTGDFSKATDGKMVFEEGHDIYPQKLWKMLLNRIKG